MKTIKYLTTIALLLLLLAVGCDKGDDITTPKETEEPFSSPINTPVERYSLTEFKEFWWNAIDCDGKSDFDIDFSYSDFLSKRIDCGPKAVVINSYDELDPYFNSSYVCCILSGVESHRIYPPSIDFSKQTLLLATGVAVSGISGISGWRLEQFSPNRYKLNVELALNQAQVLESWILPLLTDKLSEESRIEVNVTTIDVANESVVGTWKLIDVIESGTEGGEALRYQFFPYNPASIGCESYCLNFSPDKTIFGTSDINCIDGNYKTGDFNSIQINIEIADDDINESDYGKNFIRDMNERVEFYAVLENELKLYLKNYTPYHQTCYLLFEKWDGEIDVIN